VHMSVMLMSEGLLSWIPSEVVPTSLPGASTLWILPVSRLASSASSNSVWEKDSYGFIIGVLSCATVEQVGWW
jgi:hypothetical protein